MHARSPIPSSELEQGCVYLCEVMSNLASWGLKHPFSYDGLIDLGSIGLPTYQTTVGSHTEDTVESCVAYCSETKKRWTALKSKLLACQTYKNQNHLHSN